ncbi:TPA: hypothetical protein DEP94_01625 [Candidatus Nomurabacteria bacterium]|nr:hypothetical protein [Candidatus Nomurabacteria bacterium]
MWYWYIIAMAIVDTIYISVAKYWSLHTEKWYLPLFGFIALLLTNIFFLFGLTEGSGLARGTIWFSVLSSIFAVIIALYFFNEHLTTTQWIGLVLGLLAVILMK